MRALDILTCALMCCSGIGSAFQTPTPNASSLDGVQRVINNLKDARDKRASAAPGTIDTVIQRSASELAILGTVAPDYIQSVLADTERQRIDIQTGASPNASGTTSLVERGTVPYLLGAAVENGDVTRTVNGTSITFQARPAGLLKFFQIHDYAKSAITSQSDQWAQILNKASGSVTFDVSRGNTSDVFTGSTNQVSGYSFHFDLFNRRDPRDPRYRSDWLALTRGRGVQLASARTELAGAIDADTGMHQWVKNTQTHLTQVMSQPGVTDQQIESAVTSLVDDLIMSMANRFQKNVNLQMLASRAADTTNEFASERIGIIQRALKSPTLAVEYLVTRQAPATAVPSTTATATAGGPVMNLPDLGTLRLIAAVGVGNGGNLTLNASMTNFNNTFRSNRIRDYRIGAQFDAPVTDIKNWGKVSFSLSALFLNLRQQPLGEDITVNNIPINSTGKIGYAQAKIEFPFGTSGIRLPLALTYASRQELLVNEKNKFGANIGLTFDLDKLVAGKSSAAPSK